MKTMKKWGAMLALFCMAMLLCSCGSSPELSTPQVSTAAERATAFDLLSTAEVALEAAIVSGAVRPEDVKAARDTVADLRTEIEQSEFVPVSWSTLLKRATALSLRWVVPRQG
jgi:hypothetical protein